MYYIHEPERYIYTRVLYVYIYIFIKDITNICVYLNYYMCVSTYDKRELSYQFQNNCGTWKKFEGET